MRRTHCYIVVVIVAALLLALPPSAAPARAQTAEVKARATRLFNEGNTLREAGNHAVALAKYNAAYALFPSYRIDFNMALSLEALGRDPGAAQHFARFLQLGAARSPTDKVKLAHEHLQALRDRVASLELACPVQGSAVVIDGKPHGTTPLPGPIYLAPGKHTAQLTRDGHHPARLDVQLAAAEHRSVEVDLRPRPAPAAVAPAELELERRRAHKSLWAYTALGVGATFATCAAVLYAVGGARGSAAYDDYQEATSTAGDPTRALQHRAELEAAQTEIAVGHVFLGLAAASAGVAIYQLVTRPDAGERRDVALTLGPGTLTLGGSF